MKYFGYRVHGEFTSFNKWKGNFAMWVTLTYVGQFKKAMFNP